MNATADLMEFVSAIEDARLASHAMFRLHEQFAGLGCDIEIDPRLWRAVIRAQRQVEAGFFEIENFLKAEARRSIQ